MNRGEVWWANMPDQWARRPVLLLARDEAYHVLNRVAVAPLTTRLRVGPTMVSLDVSDGVPRPSVVAVDNIQAIRIEWLDGLVARLRPEKMQEVERAIHFALALTTGCPPRSPAT